MTGKAILVPSTAEASPVVISGEIVGSVSVILKDDPEQPNKVATILV